MASISVQIGDDLQARANIEPERLGTTSSEHLSQKLHVDRSSHLPPNPAFMREEGDTLIAIVRERLSTPQRIKVLLDDL